jgi:hypothetical protein
LFRTIAAALGMLACAAALPSADGAGGQAGSLSFAGREQLAPGVIYYRLDAPAYFGAEAPVSARLLEVRPEAAHLDLELGKGGIQGRDTVPAMAARRGAMAAVNAGFFGTNGDPAGIFKINGLLVSDTQRPRGAVGFARPQGPPLIFDQVTARARARIGGVTVPATGVDTARGSHAVVIYTPRYGTTTRTAGDGVEWTLEGRPLRVTAIRRSEASAIPTGGFVMSASGPITRALSRLRLRDRVDLFFTYTTALGTAPGDWERADDIVGGAGLLLWRGREVRDWATERLDRKGFVEARHPRTLIGRDREGDTWMVVVDGRQPGHSVGMSLPELTQLSRRLGLVDALNLDGGGSSTLVIRGTVANRPSDPTGPRPVSDAIVVLGK